MSVEDRVQKIVCEQLGVSAEEVKLEASEKERVFVDTCEEKDAIIDELREQIRTADNRAQAAYSAQLQENNAKVHSLEKEITILNKSAALLREHEHTIDALKTKLKALDTSKTEPKSIEKSLTKNTNTKTKSKTNLESAFSAPAKGLKIAAAKVKDELQAIKGIGPKMEKTLNEFGIYSFEQLANLAKDDIKMLADKLGGFPGRIDRDKWVSQSKKHLKKKYGIEVS